MRGVRIKVNNLSKKYRVNVRLVELIVKKVLGKTDCRGPRDLEVQFADDGPIRELNRRFKHRDRKTDVLSFDLDGTGSIAISLDAAFRNARAFGSPFHKEAVRYVIHGILHLSGYDDASVPGRLEMSAEEDRLLGIICMNADLSKALTRP